MSTSALVEDCVGPFDLADRAASALQAATGIEAHDIAVVLGSGWAAAADLLGEISEEVEMSTLPGFAPPQVSGHRDLIRSISVGGRSILVFCGRSHLYEGVSADDVVHGVRTAAAAGCKAVILTNAAGSLRPEWDIGQVVLIGDHINMTGTSPMVGPPPPSSQPNRFCDLSNAYSPRLRSVCRTVSPATPEGVYAGLLGGSYETPAEISMLRTLGADLVGMSTVLETIAARHVEMEVLGLSLVTNLAAGMAPGSLSHAEVLMAANDAREEMVYLIRRVLENLWSPS